MPRPLKPRKRGKPAIQANPDPEVVEALSLAGVPAARIATLLGLTPATLARRYPDCLKPGPKMPAARVAALVRRLVEIAERASLMQDVPALISAIRLLAGVHLPELHAGQAPAKPSEPPDEAPVFQDGPAPSPLEHP